MHRPAELDRELVGTGIEGRFANPCAWGLVEGEELLLRSDEDRGRVVQAKVPHCLAKFKHPLRRSLDSGKGIALRGDLQTLLDGLLCSWRRKAVAFDSVEEMPLWGIARPRRG